MPENISFDDLANQRGNSDDPAKVPGRLSLFQKLRLTATKAMATATEAETCGVLPVSPWNQPFFGVFTALFIFFVAIWTYAIPGYFALRDDVLTSSGVARHLKGEAATKWQAYLNLKAEYQSRIKSIDAQLALPGKSPQDMSALFALRDRYKAEEHAQPPLIVMGMIGHWLNEIWAMSYLTLGCLIAIWAYPRVALRPLPIVGWTVILYLLSLMQLWTRNYILMSPDLGRTTFLWVNQDISMTSYVLQDIRQCVMFLFICIFWELGGQRLKILRKAVEDRTRWPRNPIARLTYVLSIFRRAQALWQLSTVLMLVLFVPWSLFYWNQIAVNKDMRYLPAVLLIDLIVMVTWFVASRPFLLAMNL
jgi:hypothetical protein